MRIAFVTTGGARATFLVRRALEAFSDVCVLRVTSGPPAAAPPGGRLKRLVTAPHEVVATRFADAYRARRSSHLERALSQRLHGADAPPPLPGDVVIDVPRAELHAPATLARLADVDVLVTASAPILKASLLDLPRGGALNVHFGVAPEYRGEHTLYWALARGDWSHVGVTLHHLDAGIDTGRILARGHVALSPADTEIDVLTNATRLAAELLLDTLRAAAPACRLPPGRAQPGRGRLYLRKHRTAAADLAYAARRALGERPPRIDSAVERYFSAAAGTAAEPVETARAAAATPRPDASA